MKIAIRQCSEADIPAMLEIECASFPDPWTAGMFRSALAQKGVHLYAATDELGNIIGYAELYDDGYDCVVISNIAVAANHRRRGVGSELLKHAERQTSELIRPCLTLEVRASNLAAIRLYEKFGFRTEGSRPGYYLHPREDAEIMSKYYDYSVC
ncbi:MAG: ribosomal protein S18-alanine N-acetyltransferase [Oscillospiraceae bacterium]|jgi:ribosomal-protein-alanine N-acetyltransferase|nr:ribosomal protein S18-alanine N-acetyltransferase [Oscillospiraceae bacterium]